MPRAARSSDLKAEVGQRLREFRDAANLKATEVCAAIGVEPNTFSQWEHGRTLLDVTAAMRLRARFGVTLDFLYCNDLASLPNRMAETILERRQAKNPIVNHNRPAVRPFGRAKRHSA